MSILLMNASGPNTNAGTASERKAEIKRISDTEKPALMLFQEFKWKNLRHWSWGENELPEKYCRVGNTEAAIVYDRNKFDAREIPEYVIGSILSHPGNRFPVDFTPRPRMCIRLIIKKNERNIRFLCVSWHGEYKVSLEYKKLHFQYLLQFVELVNSREGYRVPILIGGDFNVEMCHISDIVKSNERLEVCDYRASKRRENKVLDFFIKSKEITFEILNTKYLVLQERALRVFDHDPLSCTLHQMDKRELQIVVE